MEDKSVYRKACHVTDVNNTKKVVNIHTNVESVVKRSKNTKLAASIVITSKCLPIQVLYCCATFPHINLLFYYVLWQIKFFFILLLESTPNKFTYFSTATEDPPSWLLR